VEGGDSKENPPSYSMTLSASDLFLGEPKVYPSPVDLNDLIKMRGEPRDLQGSAFFASSRTLLISAKRISSVGRFQILFKKPGVPAVSNHEVHV
jgi:hypothetical protein